MDDQLVSYIKTLSKNGPEQFIWLPFDKSYIEEIKLKAGKYRKFGSVAVIGIGGSNLGTLAVWQALRGRDEKMFFVETLDSRNLNRILNKLGHPATIAIISKSGTTIETVANAGALISRLSKKDKVVAVTDEQSKLWQWAKKYNYDVLTVPKEVVGRYSVLSAVGLFPLAVAGIDIDELIAGACEATEVCLSADLAKNPAAGAALKIYEQCEMGKTIHDWFLFEPDLEGVGKWYRQLTGESIGKGGKGITPTVSIGSADLHSVGQLYVDGPKDKFTTFVSVKNHGADFEIPVEPNVDNLVPNLTGKKFGELLAAILEGTKATYRKHKLPFAEIELEELSERTIGALLQTKMIEMIYLAKLLDVNAFDQPAVELYKEETRKLLKQL